ncbi:hypothetical protein KHP62_03450 [Rhodobacteraceae bacterium NNCM2]|nr:hypothetical protein [Coraliihabitans acroporae]
MTETTDRTPEKPQDPWLVRPATIRGIWIVSIAVLVVLLLLDFVIPKKGTYFEIQTIFGFGAWYGFLVCTALVFISKVLGMLLKVRDDFYDD